jgi:cobalamin biosynthetic protein CobC
LIAARLQFPDAPEPWIDLSTGINAVPYTVELPMEAFTRLPEPASVTALEAIAAQAYGVSDPAMVVAAPGTQSLIHVLPRLLLGRRVTIVGPTYGEHAAAWTQGGSRVRMVDRLAAVRSPDVVVVVNPNNPDGARLPRMELLAIADRMAESGGVLIVDEAFADLEVGTLAPLLPRPGLLLLRSFGKAYGLAGLRLGFMLGDASLTAMVRQALGPWAVSGPAVWIGRTALADESWRQAAMARLTRDVERLDTLLQESGCRVIGGTRLFRLGALDNANGAFERLARRGILVRRFAGNPRWLRFGIPAGEGWDRLEAARDALIG